MTSRGVGYVRSCCRPEEPQPDGETDLRWCRPLAAILLVTGPLLQAIEFLLEIGTDDNAARVAFWAAHPDQAGLSMASGLLAVPFLMGGSVVLVALTRVVSRRLAWMGGTLMAFGLVVLGAGHGYGLAAYGFTRLGDQSSAIAILNAENLGLPGMVKSQPQAQDGPATS